MRNRFELPMMISQPMKFLKEKFHQELQDTGFSRSLAYKILQGDILPVVSSGHIIKKGKKSVFLDDFAVRFLCPQVVLVETLDDQFSEIRRAIEDRQKEAAGIKEDVSKMAEELTALTTVFNDSRKLTDEKLEQALIRTAMTDDKISTSIKQFMKFEESLREISNRITKIEEKVSDLSVKKGLFGRM